MIKSVHPNQIADIKFSNLFTYILNDNPHIFCLICNLSKKELQENCIFCKINDRLKSIDRPDFVYKTDWFLSNVQIIMIRWKAQYFRWVICSINWQYIRLTPRAFFPKFEKLLNYILLNTPNILYSQHIRNHTFDAQ